MRHTKREVLARTRREFAALDRLVRAEAANPGPVDVLAHIVYWKEHSARVFRGERRLSEMRGLGVDQSNRLVYRPWRRRSPRALVARHRRVHAEVLATLAGNPEAWFGGRQRSAEWPLDFDGHSAAHRVRDIESVLPATRVTGRGRP